MSFRKLNNPMHRRDWMQVGGLGAFGMTLPQLLKRPAAASAPAVAGNTFGRA